MTSTEVPSTGIIAHADIFSISLLFLLLYLSSVIATAVYNAFLGPLSQFPGPKYNAISILPLIRTTWKGNDNTDLTSLHQKYGEVVRIAPNQLSFTGDAQIWKDVYGFRKQGQLEVVKDPLFYGQPVNKTPGIITANAATHSRQRKIVSHAFSDKALKEQEPLLKTWAIKLKTKLAEKAQKGEKTDMLKMLNCTTFDIMGDLTFAEPLYMLDNSEYVPWVKMIFGGIKYATGIRALKMFNQFTKWLFQALFRRVPSMRKKQAEHWKYTTDRVDRRLAKTPDRPDLWSVILERGGEPLDTPQPGPAALSLQEHYSIASLFMIAGTETTATALSGTTYHLLQNPQYMDMLQKELRTAFSSIDDIHLEPLAKLPVLDACIKEGIRMYPPVPIAMPRVSPPGGMLVGDHFVPEGTTIGVHHLSTYRREANFKLPYEFRPERWLGDQQFKDDKLDSFEPFMVGPRNCLGKNLAWHEMRLLLSTVLLYFDLELCKDSARWADQKVYTLWEKPALMCTLRAVKP